MTNYMKYINKIEDYLLSFKERVKLDNACGYNDINKEAESIFRELLNMIYGYNLKCLDRGSTREIAIDLGDLENRISIQVTSTSTAEKVRNTIDKFISNKKYDFYDRLIIFRIGDNKNTRAKFDTKGYFNFNPKKDIWSIDTIINELSNKDIKELEKIYECVVKYFSNEAFIPWKIKKQNESLQKYLIERKCIPLDNYDDYSYGSSEGLSIIEEVYKHKSIVILNDAAFGKTIVAKMLCNKVNDNNEELFAFYYRLNVYTNQRIEELIPTEYKNVPKENLVIILDGFDEINNNSISTFVSNLEAFKRKFNECSVVVTSRINFYKRSHEKLSGTFENFKEYALCPIETDDINEFLKHENITENEFWYEVNKNEYSNMIKSPFYLCELVKLFKQNKKLSNKTDLMNDIIKNSFILDENKYKNEQIIEKEKNNIYKLLRIIAFSLECLGRNYLTNDEYEELILQKDQIDLLKHCALWNKMNNGNWSFKHNNFGEYLAAEQLYQYPLDKVKKLVTYSSNPNIIKPSWCNAITFLANKYYNNKEFIGWIIDVQPELLSQLEDTIIDNDMKVSIFKSIFTKYEDKRIWLENSQNILNGFSNNELILFLCNKIKENNHFTIVHNALLLLFFINSLCYSTNEVYEISKIVCMSNSYRSYEKYYALKVLGKHNLVDSKLLNEIIEANIDIEDSYLRSGYFYICNVCKLVDENIQLIIEKSIMKKNEIIATWDQEDDNVTFLAEKLELDKCLENITTFEALSVIVTNIKKDIYIDFAEDYIKSICKSARNLYLIDKRAIDIFIELLCDSNIYWRNNLVNIIIRSIDLCNIRSEVFTKILIENTTKLNVRVLELLMDNTCLAIFIKNYKNDKFDNDVALHILKNETCEKLDNYKELVKIYESKVGLSYVPPKKINWTQIKIDGVNCYVDALFNQELFQNLFRKFLGMFDKDIITRKDILKFNYELIEQNIELQRMRYFVLFNTNYDDVVIDNSFFEKFNWNILILQQLYILIEREKYNLVLDKDNEDKLKQICFNLLKEVDFRNHQDNLRLYLWFFRNKYNWKYPNEIMLDMLEFDYFIESKLLGIQYIIDAVPYSLVKNRIIENLSKKVLEDIIFENHIKFCIDNKINECIKPVSKIFFNETYSSNKRFIAGKYIYNFVDVKEFITTYLSKSTEDVYWQMLNFAFNNDKSSLTNYIIKCLKDTVDEEIKLKYSKYLIVANCLEGLEYYYYWMKKHRKAFDSLDVDSININEAISTISTKESINYLVKIIELYYESDFKDSKYTSVLSSAHKALVSIGSHDENCYRLIKKRIQDLIEKRNDLKNIGFCHYIIRDLDTSYYNATEKRISIKDVINLLIELKPKENTTNYNWLH